MKLNAKLILGAFLVLSALPLYGAASWWEQMDYGRFLSASFNSQATKGADGKTIQGKSTLEGAKAGSATNKGIAVKLGKEGDAAFLFDTDVTSFLERTHQDLCQEFVQWAAPRPISEEAAEVLVARANRLGSFYKDFDELVSRYMKHHQKGA